MDDMSVIEARALTKTFQIQRRAPGLRGALTSLFAPDHRTVQAVRPLSFSVEAGETVAFIGPNGAGKSTTIKMLTGILHPTDGTARVAGCCPWNDRTRLAYHIGCVFGQRSQLWYHLPVGDSFDVLGAVFDIPVEHRRRRVDRLVDLLDLREFQDVPVRKLSLGQRMRCEVAACLLHEPEILFLDEPTIGLDVVAKRTIRDLILRCNEQERTTIFLTSHDAGDIEQLCKRVIIVNDGTIVLDLPVKDLKRRYLALKTVGIRFESDPGELPVRPGLTLEKRKGPGAKFSVDTSVLDIGSALAALAAAGRVADITVTDPPLEQVIARIYQGGDDRG